MKENSAARKRHKARSFPAVQYSTSPPQIPTPIEVFYLAADPSILQSASSTFGEKIVTTNIHYKPAILAMARLTFQGRWDVHHQRDIVKVVSFPPAARQADWDKTILERWDNKSTQSSPAGDSFFVVDPSCDFSSGRFELLQEEFLQFLISEEVLTLNLNPYLKIYRRIDEPEETFFERCMEEIRTSFSKELNALEETILRQKNRLKERLEREVREREEQQKEGPSQEIKEINQELAALEELRESKRKELEKSLHTLSRDQELDILRLNRNHVEVLRFALVWLPYTEFVIQEKDHRRLELVQSF